MLGDHAFKIITTYHRGECVKHTEKLLLLSSTAHHESYTRAWRFVDFYGNIMIMLPELISVISMALGNQQIALCHWHSLKKYEQINHTSLLTTIIFQRLNKTHPNSLHTLYNVWQKQVFSVNIIHHTTVHIASLIGYTIDHQFWFKEPGDPWWRHQMESFSA